MTQAPLHKGRGDRGRMGGLWALLLQVITFTLVFAQQDELIPSTQFGGFDVIFSNDTSYLDDIDSHGDLLYVSSQGLIREVSLDPSFSLEYESRYFRQDHRYIDFKAFDDSNNKTWVVGPTTAHHIPGTNGYSHPIQFASVDTSFTIAFDAAGILYSAIHTHTSNITQNTFSYVAGWVLSGNTVNFALNRLDFVPNPSNTSAPFTINAANDLLLNSTTGYEDFYRTYKPKIFRAGNPLYYVLVADPSSHCIYKISTPNDDAAKPDQFISAGSLCLSSQFGGAAFDFSNQILYVGQKAVGSNNGSIAVISTDTLTLKGTIQLQRYQSNPVSLSIHEGTLYVGLNGASSMLKINANLTLQYSTVPTYLRNVQAIHARRGAVYFVTYDQFAKVARASEENFCYSKCDSQYGFCVARTCKCIDGAYLSVNGRTCYPIMQNGPSHAGEVALGLLFAVTLLTAVIGWFLLWKIRRGHVRTEYSANLTDEHDRFLGQDDDTS